VSLLVLDSSAWIEYFGDKPKAQRIEPYLERPELLRVPAIIFYEVYKRALGTFGEEVAKSAVGRLSRSPAIPIDRDVSLVAAELSLNLRLAMADAMILAAARSCGAELVTLDADFRGIPGVRVL
jgi:predicted nucleic acid-binding protein